jgi:hypothetical protein
MTNREWIIVYSNPYDILTLMQKHRGYCVIEDIDNVVEADCIRFGDSPYKNCEQCIENWLNKERI